MTILIVEDDRVQAEGLCRLMKEASPNDLDISIARSLAEGIEMSERLRCDITYLDLSLPDASVSEVIEAIARFFPPVIIITALDDPNQDLKLKCFAHGAQNFFRKPTDIKLIIPHLLSTGAAAHLRREAPKLLAQGEPRLLLPGP